MMARDRLARRRRAEADVDRAAWARIPPEQKVPRCAKCGAPMPGARPFDLFCVDCRSVVA